VAVVTGAGRGWAPRWRWHSRKPVRTCHCVPDAVPTRGSRRTIQSTGRRAEIVVADLAHPEDTAKLAGKAVERSAN